MKELPFKITYPFFQNLKNIMDTLKTPNKHIGR